MRRPLRLSAVVVAALLATTACSGDDPAPPTSTSSSSTTSAPAEPDEALRALMLEAADLPDGFAPSADVDDTITSFCANEDATAGLRATSREIRGFTRTPAGASVIQVAFRFADDGAARLVEQAGGILERCSGVPDVKGLAFEYDALDPALDAAVAGATDAHVGRHGANVGSGSLSIDLVVLHKGDVGQLVAVLGLDLPRSDLDALASAAFGAVVAKLSP